MGLYLGATFASMYPNRVGRLVLDGVVDAEDYYAGESSQFPDHSLLLIT